MAREPSIALVANGAHDDVSWLQQELSTFQVIVGVDGGLDTIIACGLSAHEAIGDFDSATQPKTIPTKVFKREKDDTDLALALKKYTQNGEKNVTVFGALGKGIDHEIANLLLLHKYPDVVEYRFPNGNILCSSKNLRFTSIEGSRIALFSLGPHTIVSTTGLQWNLSKNELNYLSYSVSNTPDSPEWGIEIHQGNALIYCAY